MTDDEPHTVLGLDAWKRDNRVAKTLVFGLLFGVLGIGLGVLLSHFYLCGQ
jgi:hypothetical protein